MRIPITPLTIATDNGDVTCTEAEVSVAVSSSTAIRLVPVDDDGIQYPEAALGIVGTPDTLDIATFMDAVTDAVVDLAAGRGI